MTIAIIIILIVIIGAVYEHNRKKRNRATTVEPVPTPAPVVQSIAGRYTGTLTPPKAPDGSMLAWGAPNDEHDPKVTASVLAARPLENRNGQMVPDWLHRGYCPGGDFDFTIHENRQITGGGNVFGDKEPIAGGPHFVDSNGNVTMPLECHWISLSFADGAITGKLWEGHDELKRSIVSGRRV